MQARHFFLLLLLIAPIALPAALPQLATSSEITISQQGTVGIVGGRMQSIAMNLSMPIPSEYQSVQYGGSTIHDAEGNNYIRIEEKKPDNPFSYSESLGVDVLSRRTLSLPGSYTVPPEYSRYLQPSEKTESDNPKIRQAALEAVEGAQDPFERISRLAIFVNSHMEYDETLVGQEKGALFALEARRGVCAEYAALFAALARSIGIPARYVSGYAQSDRMQGFVGHAWNEAYIGEWVPVDATWFEVGNLDALHIEEAKYAENQKRNTLSATVDSPSAKVEWETPGQGGASAGYVKAESVEYGEPMEDFEFAAVRQTLLPGGSTVVYLSLTGKEYVAMPVTLATCSGANIIGINDADQFAILQPGKNAVLAWEITAEKSLDKGYVFTCPLTLNSPYIARRSITITVDAGAGKAQAFTAQLSSPFSSQGEANSVLITSASQLAGAEFFVFLPSSLERKKLSGKAGEIPFQSPWPGKHGVLVASSAGSLYKLALAVPKQNQTLSITSLSANKGQAELVPSYASATIASSHYPSDIRMAFSYCGGQQTSSARLSSPTSFRFDFTPQKAGACTISLEAEEVSTGNSVQKGVVAEVAPAQEKTEQPSLPSRQDARQPSQQCLLPLSMLSMAAIAAARR